MFQPCLPISSQGPYDYRGRGTPRHGQDRSIHMSGCDTVTVQSMDRDCQGTHQLADLNWRRFSDESWRDGRQEEMNCPACYQLRKTRDNFPRVPFSWIEAIKNTWSFRFVLVGDNHKSSQLLFLCHKSSILPGPKCYHRAYIDNQASASSVAVSAVVSYRLPSQTGDARARQLRPLPGS